VAAPAWLFQPPTVHRVRPAGFTGTPLPKDEPTAPNPPSGANIDYVLAKPAAQPITLEIHDASGELVHRLSSADTVAKPDPARMRTAPQWIVPPPHLEVTAGMHRVTWPMTYAPPPGRGEGARGAGGVFAPPGEYKVTLTVDGRPLDRTLTLLPDPRVKLEASAYREQFDLARSIEAMSAKVTQAATAAGKVRKAAADLRAQAGKPLADTLDAFQARLLLLSGEVMGANPANANAFPPKRIESLRWISGALGNLQRMVDGADAAPSPDAQEAWTKLQAMAESALGAWQQFVATDLDALNLRLETAGMKPIAVTP